MDRDVAHSNGLGVNALSVFQTSGLGHRQQHGHRSGGDPQARRWGLQRYLVSRLLRRLNRASAPCSQRAPFFQSCEDVHLYSQPQNVGFTLRYRTGAKRCSPARSGWVMQGPGYELPRTLSGGVPRTLLLGLWVNKVRKGPEPRKGAPARVLP